MTAKQIAKALKCVKYGERFEVGLKTGETVVCQCNPSRTEIEVAFQQTLARETLTRGDILKPSEIASL